jgi:hypothetical protein
MPGKGFSVLPLFLGVISFAYGQQSVLRVDNSQDFHKVALSVESANGYSIIQAHDEDDLVAIYRDSESGTKPAVREEIVDGIKKIRLQVDDRVIDCMERAFFSSGTPEAVHPYQWKVFLARHKPVDLDLHYALGDAFLDLSDLDVQNLRIRSGHANVVVDHLKAGRALSQMDSLFIDVDWGSIEVQNIHRTNVRNIHADIGFGKMYFDLSNAHRFEGQVFVTVGAGKLNVQLPHEAFPVKVIIGDSPLCRVRLDDKFTRVDSNTYTLGVEDGSANAPLVFHVNVGMGSISFNTAAR